MMSLPPPSSRHIISAPLLHSRENSQERSRENSTSMDSQTSEITKPVSGQCNIIQSNGHCSISIPAQRIKDLPLNSKYPVTLIPIYALQSLNQYHKELLRPNHQRRTNQTHKRHLSKSKQQRLFNAIIYVTAAERHAAINHSIDSDFRIPRLG